MFKIGTFAIITNHNNEFLFCRRKDYDFWNLPGGTVEKGETPWDAVVREVKEETGLEVETEYLWGIYVKNTDEGDSIVFNYKCKVVSGEIVSTDEADEIKYFKVEDIPKNTSVSQVERIKDYINNSKGLVTKQKIGGKSSIQLVKEDKL